MEPVILKIRDYLLQKQAALSAWLRAGQEVRSRQAGEAGIEAVASHLQVVQASLGRADSGTLGLCQVCGDSVQSELLELDYTASVCLEHLSPQETQRLEYELELAQTVQQALMPQETTNIPGLEVAAYSRPAQFVGGDYIDFIPFNTDTFGLVLADVAGHGLSASLQMANLQALARAIVPTRPSPAEVVTQIQRLFVHNIRFSTFASLFMGAFAPATRCFTYCNAGHNPPFVLHRQRHGQAPITWLERTGPALGLVESSDYSERTLILEPHDLLILFTDGVVEAADSNQAFYGAERLVETVTRLSELTPREIVRGIRESLEAFTAAGATGDDITYLVCRVT